MLKKLFSAFTKNSGKPVAETDPAPPVLIKVYDAYGREFQMARIEWRDKVLLPNLEKNANNPEALYNQIVLALNDGFTAELLKAAKRLQAIDPNVERGHTIHGIVLLKNNRLEEAEATLRRGMAQAGETATLLTNLAKVYAQKGDRAKADETLWKAIQTDPNTDNGLLWWAALEQERRGEAGYLDALRTVAALPGSWRAQMWLARHHLDGGDLPAARALYEQVLQANQASDALMMMSGDLGNHGHIALIPELIAPIYDPAKAGWETGLNLVQAYLTLDRLDDGEALLSTMYQLNLPPIKPHLDRLSAALQSKRRESLASKPVDAESLHPVTLPLTEPIWHYGLRNADWLFQPKPKEGPTVGIFALAQLQPEKTTAEEQQEDDLGRLTRAIPLYLAESIHHWTDLAATTYIHIIPGGGPVVFGGEADPSDQFDQLPANLTHLVTGHLRSLQGAGGDLEMTISLKLWDCVKRERVAEESATCLKKDLGASILRLEQQLLWHFGEIRRNPLDPIYERPTAEMMAPYLIELGQLFMLTLVANQIMAKELIWGERNILGWPLSMSLQWPDSKVSKLMFLSGVSRAMDYESTVLPEFKARALELLKEDRKKRGILTDCAPLLYKAFDMAEELAASLEKLPDNTSQGYRTWLDRISQPPASS